MLSVRWTPFSLGECQRVDSCVEVEIEECEECENSVRFVYLSTEELQFR